MNGACRVSRMLKGPRQTPNTEPARVQSGFHPVTDSSVSQTAARLPAPPPDRTEPGLTHTGGVSSVTHRPDDILSVFMSEKDSGSALFISTAERETFISSVIGLSGGKHSFENE